MTRRGLTTCLALLLCASALVRAEEAERILRGADVRGGVVVHLGCGNGELTAALCAGDSYLVQGLAGGTETAARARQFIRSKDLSGPVSVRALRGGRLPYVDDMVNLLVVSDDCGVSRKEMERVLAPGGVLWRNGVRFVKPWPDDIDGWTHLMHGPDGNPVSSDTRVGPPAYAQWVIGPNWPRHHDSGGSSYTGMVSDNGRLFTIRDEAPAFSTFVPSEGCLVAQDAFNGKVLWRRAIADWVFPGNRGGPAALPRRLVAVGDCVYVALGLDAPVSVLDAATGEEVMTLPESDHAGEIVVSGDTIFVTTGLAGETAWAKASKVGFWEPSERRLKAYERESGRLLWEKKTGMLPVTLAVAAGGVYYHDTDRVVCLDPATGERRWQGADMPFKEKFSRSKAPIMLVKDGVVLYSMTTVGGRSMGASTLHAFDAKDGDGLWAAEFPPMGNCCPKDLFVINGVVYMYTRTGGMKVIGLDLHTGAKRKEFEPKNDPAYFHARCHRYKATERYIIPSNQGFELIDPEKETWDVFFWIRGACNFGYLPANGFLYLPPGPCVCFTDTMLHGTYALATRAEWMDDLEGVDDRGCLVQGDAYQSVQGTSRGVAVQPAEGWSTYRAGPARRGYTPAQIPGNLEQQWRTSLGGKLTAPVSAAGRVFVAQVDRHVLHALDDDTGEPLWAHATGGRIDSPPTIMRTGDGKHLCVFGCRDGYVYCLRASDGALVWRYRAAPLELQMNARGQIESLWPVHGSVLLQNGRIYCVAGRSIYLAGGMRMLQLDPVSGQKLSETVLDPKNPETGETVHFDTRDEPGMPVALPDILSSDGRHIYMRSQQFDMEGNRTFFRNRLRNNDFRVNRGYLLELMQESERHLFSPAGFLDDSWFHRHYWTYANVMTYASGQFHLARRFYPSGRIMVLDDQKIYTYARKPKHRRWMTSSVEECQLLRTDLRPELEPLAEKVGRSKWASNQTYAADWGVDVGVLPRAIAKAGDRVFLAGPPDVIGRHRDEFTSPWQQGQYAGEQLEAWRGALGASLLAVSPADGEVLQEVELSAPPVWDGMAAAEGRVFICLDDGAVVCLGGR